MTTTTTTRAAGDTRAGTRGQRDGLVKRGATWSYVVWVPDPDTGRGKAKWVGGFGTEAAAKAARDDARVKVRRAEYVDRSRVTVREYLREWLEAHAVSVRPKTLSGYREDLERYVLPRIGGMRLQALRPATLSTLYRELADAGGRGGRPLSPATVAHVHRTLRKALADAVDVEQLLATNPAQRAKRPKASARAEPLTLWTPAQLRAFLEAAAAHRLEAFYRLAAYTGARRGELLALRWSDVDLDAGEVRIAGSTDVIDGDRVEGATKSGRSRVVSMDAETVRVVREHRRRQAGERLAAGPHWRGGDDGHVFATELGDPLYPDTPTQLLTKLAAGAGLPRVRLHDLRHLHATTLLLAGVPVHVVANRLGHADPAITLRVYAHVLREHAAGVADTFAAAVAGGP